MGYRPPPPPPVPSEYPPGYILLYGNEPGIVHRFIHWVLSFLRHSKSKNDDKLKRDVYIGCYIGDDGEIVYPVSDMPKPRQNGSYGTVTK